jgi:hypothetical protein
MQLQTDSKILGEIASLQQKISRLEALRALSPYEQCHFFFYSSSGKFLALNENDVPYNLSFEIRILIDAALDHYNFEIKRLENSFQCDAN